MKDFENILQYAIKICEGKLPNTMFDRVYSFTTENVSDYLRYFDCKDKSLLTIGSSGDQVLNAYYKGFKDLTLIDINPFSKFYLYLKISAIISLSYEEFKLFFFVHGTKEYYNKSLLSKEIFNKIKQTLKLLDYESYLFFDTLFGLFKSKTIKEELINFDEVRNTVICGFNNYLRNETTYNILKKQLHDISFTFINEDIFKYESIKKYDNIFLSNLSCCCTMDKFKELINKLSQANLNNYGKVLLAYLWDVNYDEIGYDEEWNHMYNIPLVKQQLEKYITEHYEIKDGKSIIWESDKKRDLILVYNKR